MSENRHPINKIGMENMLAAIIAQWEAETQFGETEVVFYPDAKVQDVQCKVIVTSHPQPRRQFKFQRTQLYIDKSNNLPIRLEQYGWPVQPGEKPPLIEEYNYKDLKINVGLTGKDFDPRNPQYRF